MQYAKSRVLALGFCALVFLSASERTLSQAAATGEAPPSSGHNEQRLHGRIASIDSDDDGCIDREMLRHGTVVTPVGLTLSVSTRVTVHGHKVRNGSEATAIRAHYVYVRPATRSTRPWCLSVRKPYCC